MTKIQINRKCLDCKRCDDYPVGEYYCFHPHIGERRFDDPTIIQSWCPLEDAPEYETMDLSIEMIDDTADKGAENE